MKKIFTLVAAVMVSAVSFAQTYSWSSSSDGVVTEVGGKAVTEMATDERVNYPVTVADVNYYTICLNGKVGNINDAAVDNSKNTSARIVITLNNALAKGDKISLTGFLNKNEEKSASAAIVFENGTEIDSEDFPNIGLDNSLKPGTQTFDVPDAAVGTKVIKLSRKSSGTNVFLTSITIDSATGVSKVVEVAEDGATYNLQGVKVGSDYKGVVVKNGKKFVK